jgi:hypothetical protein
MKRATPTKLEPAKTIGIWGPSDRPITAGGITSDQQGWKIESKEPRTVHLYNVSRTPDDESVLTFRARMKSSKLEGKAYLEMRCHFIGDADDIEPFSRGVAMPLTGTAEWASFQTPFWVEKGRRIDRVKLNIVIEGKGTVWIKDIELLHGTLAK